MSRAREQELQQRIDKVLLLCATGELCLDPDCEDEDGSVVHASEVRAALTETNSDNG